MENETENSVPTGFVLNAQGVVLVLSLIQHALNKGDFFGLDDLAVVAQFTNECKEFLTEIEQHNAENAESVNVE